MAGWKWYKRYSYSVSTRAGSGLELFPRPSGQPVYGLLTMANIRKPVSLVRLLTNSSFAIALVLGLGLSLVVTREAKTATVQNEDGRVSVAQATVSASLAPIVEQPRIELLHDAPLAAAPIIKIPTIPALTLPKAAKPAHHTIKMMVTAYCACPKCCGPDAIGLTASGKDVSYNNSKFVAFNHNDLTSRSNIVS